MQMLTSPPVLCWWSYAMLTSPPVLCWWSYANAFHYSREVAAVLKLYKNRIVSWWTNDGVIGLTFNGLSMCHN